jgi:shikimate dehydrogenase
MQKIYGLLGYPLSHSFSKKYFTEKFEKERITNSIYQLFDLQSLTDFSSFVTEQIGLGLQGFNVTIPHKQNIISYLHELDHVAAQIGAVNVVKILPNKQLKGYNSDYYGFKTSLLNFINDNNNNNIITPITEKKLKALILGNGGAAQAVKVALQDLHIDYWVVSQRKSQNTISYEEVENYLQTHHLVINTTPLGMYPNTEASPTLPYHLLTTEHYLFDLVYNPAETLFMKQGKTQGAKTCNGLEMLYLQAEKAWEIWQ